MLFRWLLPKDGGGSTRRYLEFRKQMLLRQALSKDIHPFLPITLFDFTRPDDAMDARRVHQKDKGGWRISDDGVIGGFSESSAKLIRSKAELFKYTSAPSRTTTDDADCDVTDDDNDDNDDDAEPHHADGNNNNQFTPYIKWSGRIDTTPGFTDRSGFASLRSPRFPLQGANLRGMYDALEITCRSDGRFYTLNLKVATALPDDLYQGYLQETHVVKDPMGNLSGRFDTLILPFSDFAYKSMGGQRAIQHVLDKNICIESVGLALMDGVNGDFQFDLVRIRVVNLLDGKVYEESNDDTA
jgi:hypothetical protein